MKIPQAIYIVEGQDEKIVKPTDISSRAEFLSKYDGHLYCTQANCDAQISYAEITNSRNPKIFKTHKNSPHNDSCIYKIDENGNARPRKNGEEVEASLSDEHVKSIHKSLQKKKDKSDSTDTSTLGGKSKKQNKRKTPTVGTNYISSVNPDAQPVEGNSREAPVRRRQCDDILDEDFGKTRAVFGNVKNVEISDNSLKFIFETTRLSRVVVFFFNAFRNNNAQAFDVLKQIGNYINRTNSIVPCTCVGLVEDSENEIRIQIMRQIAFELDGLTIYNYAQRLKNQQSDMS